MLKIKTKFNEKTGEVHSKYKHNKTTSTAEHIGAIVALYREIIAGTKMTDDEAIEMIMNFLKAEKEMNGERINETNE